jgi:hypothetical protein
VVAPARLLWHTLALMTRVEHLAWAKERAHGLLKENDIAGAMTSLVSDLYKFEGAAATSLPIPNWRLAEGHRIILADDPAAMRSWVDSFD